MDILNDIAIAIGYIYILSSVVYVGIMLIKKIITK